jgi:hypothetical protein
VDRFGFTLHAGIRCHFLFYKHVFVIVVVVVVFFFFFFLCFCGFNKKKKMGIRCRIFILSFDSFSDIACVFA